MDAPTPADESRLDAALAAVRRKKGPAWLGRLAKDVLGRVPAEDLSPYSATEVAAFVNDAASALVERRPDRPKIDLRDVAGDGGNLKTLTIVNDNMPFLVDSVLGELRASAVDIRLVAHPILSVVRDGSGRLEDYLGTESAPPPALRESFFFAVVAGSEGAAVTETLAGQVSSVLEEVRRAVADWHPMLDRLTEIVAEYRRMPPPLPVEEVGEAIALLEWLATGNFTFLGLRDHDYSRLEGEREMPRAEATGLGILADPAIRVLSRGGEGVTLTPAIREFLARPEPLIVAKSNLKSRIHRRAYADYVGVKRYRDGRLVGETRFIGLFTSTAYTRSVGTIPYLRRKAANILRRAGFEPDSHSGKALVNVLESYPRDELFQIDEDQLFAFAMAILALEERPRVRVLARRDRFDRFVSIVVYVPRDRYDSAVRIRIGTYLAAAYDGHVSAYYPDLPEGSLARVHFIVGRGATTATPDPSQAELEAAVAGIVRTWADELSRLLVAARGPQEAARLLARYGAAFPAAYRNDYQATSALDDIGSLEGLTERGPLFVDFYRPPAAPDSTVGLKLIHRGGPLALSERVPMLEHMGFRVIDERTYDIAPAGDPPLYHLHDMTLESADREAVALGERDRKLTDCLLAVCQDEAESDGYNALVLKAGLAWRDAACLRAVSRYLQQAGIAYTQDYLAAALTRNPKIAALLVDLFRARLCPETSDAARAEAIAGEIGAALEAVRSLDEDQIVRRFQNIVEATVRTNFFQAGPDGRPRTEISFKLDSGAIEGLPLPRPFREIFVHSPRIEGIHLRFGKVARGGIRWSDRPQDFRTEILGLVKAQQVKNAVIVPVGAKGGFVPKRLPATGDRGAVMAEGTAAYRIFIANLLDITDNLGEGTVIPPKSVVRRDSDDPYLVVAADKGTATFSDIANEISAEHDFWLDDAFASGGSAGYDHKAMGITARGAWEAVKRHFREVDRDIQKEPFSVVGVGDMSGDVFGNGMLLSPATRLVAAFDHRDIFIDPDPDPATSLAERRRLFELPRSSWNDYDRGRISRGGGVFARSEKSIALSEETQRLLDLAGDRTTPREVIQAILRARVDLLWFGGIGTFVRAGHETDAEVGDRANDAVRVAASTLRAAVVGEGANLGMTQRARIEFGLAGGRCNTDAIDNSAGVNTSDVEVNIKIALAGAMRAGKLKREERNRLLASMTDDVAALVLRNNYLQPLAITLAQERGLEDLGYQARLMRGLESRGRLDRAVEFLPDDATLASRKAAGKALTRAEIATLLAYAKIALSDDLVEAGIDSDPLVAAELIEYFPKAMRTAYSGEIAAHPLRRDIVSTVLANAIINSGGPTFVVRLADATGARPAEIAKAFVATRETFEIGALETGIEALDNRVPSRVQLSLHRALQDLSIAQTGWFLRSADFSKGIERAIAERREAVGAVTAGLTKVLPETLLAAIETAATSLAEAGVPRELAQRLAALPHLAQAADIDGIAKKAGTSLETAAQAFYTVAGLFQIPRLREFARSLGLDDYYDGLALGRALQLISESHLAIATQAVAAGGPDPAASWHEARRDMVDRSMKRLKDLLDSEKPSLSRLVVAAELLDDLATA